MYRLAIRKRNGSLKLSKFVYSLKEAIAKKKASRVHFIITDSIGTPIQVR